MKVFFDTNVYVAEALLWDAAEAMIKATQSASWRNHVSKLVLEEIDRVLVDSLGFSRRLAHLTRQRCASRANFVNDRPSRHQAPDPDDSPILRAALDAGADYLVTNDEQFLGLHPYEGLRMISMTDYFRLLQNEGHL